MRATGVLEGEGGVRGTQNRYLSLLSLLYARPCAHPFISLIPAPHAFRSLLFPFS